MPRPTDFCSKWLLKFDKTGKVCSRWLIKGKTSNSFRCTACNTDDLSCANGGWSDVKKQKHNEGTTRLAAAMQNKKFDDIGTGEVLVTAANSKLATLKTKLIKNNENLN
ncbi:unnamed protein product [Adineta steineri]|uniref:Uncharacterized protein n=1 Tax=Adineta steineri TaxID=433720 RepID=A0A818Q203_9BILA|nr:unnamed protein product [Adineta steineri]CAF0923037.1 unnamed protein product [Adineta steineri]CAF1019399.1 unnamed protein product [Adineta steineri]CAF3610786.1 unnamed protein product [Adineta steineri]CAF3627969.1 unnamed protein product [Adineta steineri]